MEDAELTVLLDATVEAVRDAWSGVVDHRRPGGRPGQYAFDVAVDDAAVAVLRSGGVGVLSEESGRHGGTEPLWVAVDPVDGSTNASRGIPWFATSLAAVDEHGLRAALVVNLAVGTTYRALRGGGAWRDGEPIAVSATTELADALVVLNGFPPTHLGWRQYRTLGAAALDLCLVADGSVDAFHDTAESNLAPWDYLAAMLILTEAGGVISDARRLPLVVDDVAARRSPVAAATPELARALHVAHRRPSADAEMS